MFDQNKPTLVLVRGVSGAGKSTFAKFIANDHEIPTIAADDFMTDDDGNYRFDSTRLQECHDFCKWNAMFLLNRGESVIVHNTSTTEAEVKAYQDIAEKQGANFFSVIVENRNSTQSAHGVSDGVLQRQASRFSVKLR